MKNKLTMKRIIKLSALVGGSILVSGALGATLSSCVITIQRPNGNGQPNKSAVDINWNSKDLDSQIIQDKNGLVYADQDMTTLIAVNPKKFKSTSFSIPRTIKKITGYNEITYVNGLKTKTYRGAFEGITALQSITTMAPMGLQEISESAFKGCINLSSVTLPASTTKIGDSAFQNCAKLSNINLESVQTIGANAFNGAFASTTSTYSTNSNSSTVRELSVPRATTGVSLDLSSVRTIGNDAFKGCTQLVSVDLSKNNSQLTMLGSGAFLNCSKLNNLDLSHTAIVQIPYQGFSGCTALTSFT